MYGVVKYNRTVGYEKYAQFLAKSLKTNIIMICQYIKRHFLELYNKFKKRFHLKNSKKMSKIAIEKLVEKYNSDRNHYLSSVYNEAQLRADFLDPLFEILGWDIKNVKGRPTNEREVLLEESLKEETGANTKKPDYTFRLFSERKFYLEAKKPSVKIETDADSAKQVRRYGFTSKLKISVLSNFEYLAIYDCSEKVEENDIFSRSRIKIYHYTEYVDAFESIKAELSHESVYSGNFDKIWQNIEEQLKLFSVDILFLEQINNWRLILGKEILRYKPELSEPQLNDIVQRYINSIIFLRVCEDRNLEDYKALLSIATADNFQALIKKFIAADKKYNSGLFKHDLTEEIIKNSSSAFWTIIKQLYYPESTYSFSVFASDILGNIYEIFLGQQLVIRGNEVVLEKKADHVDRDIITTPTYIIQDILRKTVLEYCKNKTDQEILSSKFADIACGSGAFLMELYQLINDILIDYYLKNAPKNLVPIAINTYKLPFKIKRQVLENCIFGVDKDFNAVEACKFGLLLKLLEDENNSTIPVPALPDLSNIINFGNSLIDSSQTNEENRSKINPFDFGGIKFSAIVGNPPYMATEDMKQFTPLELPLYKKSYSTAYKQFDKYYLFIERSYQLLADDGYIGYIIPSKFMKVASAKMLRILLKDSKSIKKIISFGSNQVFQDKTTYTCLLILQKMRSENFEYLETKDLLDWKIRNIRNEEYDSIAASNLEDDGWALVPAYLKEVYQKINSQSIPLEELVGKENIYNGIQTSANDVYVHKPVKEDKKFIYFKKNNREWCIEKQLTKPYYETSTGVDNLNTYRPFKPNSFVIYPYIREGNDIEFVEMERLKIEFPETYKYLLTNKDRLKKRDIKPAPETENEWYRYGRHQSLEKCDVSAKIVVGVLSQGNKYAIDYSGTLISSGGTAGYCMITLPTDSKYSIYYIQALLNSKYLEWYSSLLGEVFRGGYVARGTKILKRLPIRAIDFADSRGKDLHDKIAYIQESLIKLQDKIDHNIGNDREIVLLRKEFDVLKKELEDILKQLYGLEADDACIPLISEIYGTN